MKRFIYLAFLLSGIIQICLYAQKSAISKPLYYRVPYKDYLHNYIDPQVEAWAKWDIYEESPAQYRERISEENLKLKYAQWKAEADSIYKHMYIETAPWDKFRLAGNYDPENETVLVSSDLFGSFTVHVPRGESARMFVSQFASFRVIEPDFIFLDDNMVVLNQVTFEFPSRGMRFTYDSHSQYAYKEVDDIVLNIHRVDFLAEQNVRPRTPIFNSTIDELNVDSIPHVNRISDDVYGVIIGNEHYFYELDTRFSINDATVFYEYCVRTLGIPSSNLLLRKDATYGDMLNSIQFLKNAAAAKNGNIRIIFYFSGHGMSDLKDNSMYLLPVDCSSNTLGAALKAETLYKELSDMKTISSTVFLDACFSGKSSEGALVALVDGRGIDVTPREASLYGNLVVFSATTDTEIAYPYEAKQHGMFTYFLLKNLHENKGDVTYSDLATYIINNVKSYSFDINRQPQTPKVRGSHDITDRWHGWKLIK